jgi:hypothetical protein
MERCFVPSEANVPQRLQSAFGDVAEMFVKEDYCSTKGGCHEFLKPGTAQTDFFDVAMGFARCRHLASYLKMHNPTVDEILLASQCESKKDSSKHFPVPDIITHEPPDRTEFYEIKPNSGSGKSKGVDKIIWFEIICTNEHLPYVAGTIYDPDRRVLVWDGTWFGSPVKVRLHWFRDRDALIVYELCFEVSAETFAEVLMKALIKMIVAALIALLLPVAAGAAAIASLDAATSPMGRPVGPSDVNDAADVAYAQLLLNDARGRDQLGLVAIDGHFNSIGSAITDFQEDRTLGVDGRLEPGGATLLALEGEHLSSAAQGASVATADLGGSILPPEPEFLEEAADEDSEEPPLTELAILDVDEAIAPVPQEHLDGLMEVARELVL